MSIKKFAGFGLLCMALVAFVGGNSIVNADDTFSIEVKHLINGMSLGLSKDLPVKATVNKDGGVLAVLDLSFRDSFTADLPAGEYTITVESVEVGPLPSMTVGPVDIESGTNLRLKAVLDDDGTPIIKQTGKGTRGR